MPSIHLTNEEVRLLETAATATIRHLYKSEEEIAPVLDALGVNPGAAHVDKLFTNIERVQAKLRALLYHASFTGS